MATPTPAPSNRLLRAAVAEREDLRRHREKLLARRETLRFELDRVEHSLEAVHERETLLDRLTGTASVQTTPDAVEGIDANRGSRPQVLLRGPAIRRAAVEVLLHHPDRPDALHYRDWFALVVAAGYEVAGKDPLAVFLTQLSRSPVVRKGTQSGVYELDRAAPRRLRRQLDALQSELRALATPTAATPDIAAARARRAEVHAETGRVEKALDEAAALLGDAAEEPLRAVG